MNNETSIKNFDELAEKAQRLSTIMTEAKSLVEDLASVDGIEVIFTPKDYYFKPKE